MAPLLSRIAYLLLLGQCVKTHCFVLKKSQHRSLQIHHKEPIYLEDRGIQAFGNSNPSISENGASHRISSRIYTHHSYEPPPEAGNCREMFKNGLYGHRNLTSNPVEDPGKCVIDIIAPPPNLTGRLHAGNLLNLVGCDVLKNYSRLKGHRVNINFSNDHAGQGFLKLFNKKLYEKGRIEDVGSEETEMMDDSKAGKPPDLDYIHENKRKLEMAYLSCSLTNSSHMVDLRVLGIDWPLGNFTLDREVESLTDEVFIELYNRGLIYEDDYPTFVMYTKDRIMPVSTPDFSYQVKPGTLYSLTLRTGSDERLQNSSASEQPYNLPGSSNSHGESILIHTVSPELYHATAAIGVSIEDYERLEGKRVYLPKADRFVPVIPLNSIRESDDSVKQLYKEQKGLEGTEEALSESGVRGILITPAHSQKHFTLAGKHGLEVINILGMDGKLQNVPARLEGATLSEAVDDVKDIFEDAKPVKLLSPVSYPGGDYPIYVTTTKHYMLNVKKMVPRALEELERIKVEPETRRSMLINRLNGMENWCLTRNAWWGLRPPIYNLHRGNKVVRVPARSKKEAMEKIERKTLPDLADMDDDNLNTGLPLEREGRVLDTWFSSSLWPLLQAKKYAHSSEGAAEGGRRKVLFTCYDVLESWVSKMLLVASTLDPDSLFDEVYLHSMVRSPGGQKMSKSKGNCNSLDSMLDELKMLDFENFNASHFDLCSYAKNIDEARKMDTSDLFSLKASHQEYYIDSTLKSDGHSQSNTTISAYGSDLSVSESPESHGNDISYLELMISSSVARLKLCAICTLSNWTNRSDHLLPYYVMKKFYNIFNFYAHLSKTQDSCKDSPAVAGSGPATQSQGADHTSPDKVALTESIIGAKLDHEIALIDSNLRKMKLSYSFEHLVLLFRFFSDYMVPFIRVAVTSGFRALSHFDCYFEKLAAVLYPFAPTFVTSFLLCQKFAQNMKWPLPGPANCDNSDSPYNTPDLSLFDEFQLLMTDLRQLSLSHADLNMSVSRPLFEALDTQYLQHLVRLALNRMPSISLHPK